MEYMIPWRYVLSLGLVDEPNPMPVGFNNRDVTILK